MTFRSSQARGFMLSALSLALAACANLPGVSPDEVSQSQRIEKQEKIKPLADVVKAHTEIAGLFTLYRKEQDDSLLLKLHQNQLGQEFILASHSENGTSDTGHYRGQFRGTHLVKFVRHFNRIELVKVNQFLLLDADSPVAKDPTVNLPEAVIFSTAIVGANKDSSEWVIDVTKLFKTEILTEIKNKGGSGRGTSLGSLSANKTRINKVRNYPQNISIVTDFVYDGGNDKKEPGVTDYRYSTVRFQHDFIALPDEKYQPRLEDSRVGFFTKKVENPMQESLSSPDFIKRWRLQKKDPAATLSEPIKPIEFWMENTTPEELRPLIKAAVERWNIAFEAAGFKNAIVVKQQPDNASWDAGDIRYNVLRWVASPASKFLGYAPTHINPKTGEIIAADIMLDYNVLQVHRAAAELYQVQPPIGAAVTADAEQHCSLSDSLKHSLLLSDVLLPVGDGNNQTGKAELIRQAVEFLVLHETGHALGLTHNMKASSSVTLSELVTNTAQGKALIPSVMDYPAINFAMPNQPQGDFMVRQPGEYDIWAIKFGYAPEMDQPDIRADHLAQSSKKTLAYGNDGEVMAQPGAGLDPRVNTGDLSDDAIGFAISRIKLNRQHLNSLMQQVLVPGEQHEKLRNSMNSLLMDILAQVKAPAVLIGGVLVDRSIAGQAGASAPYTPVDYKTQKRAMKFLAEYYFAPDALVLDADLLQHTGKYRRGNTGGQEDIKAQRFLNTLAIAPLSYVLNAAHLNRMVESALYGNRYLPAELLADLYRAAFQADISGTINPTRQYLQIVLVQKLGEIASSKQTLEVVKSDAFLLLKKIRKAITVNTSTDIATQSHLQLLLFKIDGFIPTTQA